MPYTITLIITKDGQSQKSISEIESYIKDKEGKIINSGSIAETRINKGKAKEAIIYRIEMELPADEVAKIKKKIAHEKEILSFLLEKSKKAPLQKAAPAKKKKEVKKPSVKAEKVIDAMEEEEKKIKDLDSTLDKILNE